MLRFSFAMFIFLIGAMFFWGCQSPEMTSAKVYIQQKEFPAALEQLKKEMKKNPTNAEAYFLAGQLYGEMDSLEQMVAVFAKAVELDSAKYSSDIKEWRASKSSKAFNKGIKLYKNKKDIEGALRWTVLATEIDPSNINAWKNLAFLYQEKAKNMRDSDVADSAKYYDDLRFQTYRKLSDIAPDDDEVLWILAGLFTERGMADSAIAILKPRLSDTREPKIFFAAADAYDAQNDTKNALLMLTKAESIDPENAGLLFDIGVRYYNMKNFEKAAQYFDKVIAKKPDNIDALYNKALALFYAEKYEEAEKATVELVQKDSKNPDAWDQLALIWASMKKGTNATTAEKIGKALKAGNMEQAKKLAEKVGINIK